MGTKYLVVGAGISGVSAAIFLAERGAQVHIQETAPRPGGLLRPVSFADLRLDLGSHRIHPEATQDLASLPVEWVEKERRGVLVLGGRHIEYPPSLTGFLRGLGIKQSLQFAASFLTRRASFQKFQTWERDRSELSHDLGFADFVQERTGNAAYQAFYQPYAEKVFGISANELSQSVAKKRLSTSRPIRSLVDSFLSRHKTFLYPKGGIAAFVDALVERAKSLGVTFEYNAPFLPKESISQYTSLLFSGYPDGLIPETKLSYRGLYVLYLSLPEGSVSGVDTFYTPEKKFWFGRVSIPQNFSGVYQKKGEEVLCVEIPEAQFGAQENFVAKADTILAQLVEAKILPTRARLQTIKQIFLPRVYPLYRRGWLEDWRATMQQIVALGNVFPFGRQGLFLHCNIDHCVRLSQLLAGHLMQQKTPQEWIASAAQYLDVRVRD